MTEQNPRELIAEAREYAEVCRLTRSGPPSQADYIDNLAVALESALDENERLKSKALFEVRCNMQASAAKKGADAENERLRGIVAEALMTYDHWNWNDFPSKTDGEQFTRVKQILSKAANP